MRRLPGRKVLLDEIQEKRALAGAGLTNDVEVPAALLGVEGDIAAQRVSADAELLMYCSHSQNGAGVPCTPQVGNMVRAAPSFPVRMRQGYIISATTTKTGLKVLCELDENKYQKGIVVSDAEMAGLNITRAEFHGEWNYTIAPSNKSCEAVVS